MLNLKAIGKMKTNTTVGLSSNGEYWQALYYDTMGKRRAKSLGPKNELSKRQAKVMCDRLAVELNLNPGMADTGQPIKLDDLIIRYLKSRTDIRKTTLNLHELTGKYIKEFFGTEIYINRITRAMTSSWRTAMATGELSLNQHRRIMKEVSVCIHVRNAKTIFNYAVKDDLILLNPFDRLKGNAAEPDKDWKHVSLEDLDRLLDACPNWGWKMLIAFCRLAGLRRGEALGLNWSNIDWQKHQLNIIAEKTGRRRVIPIEPILYQLLLDAFDQAQESEERICPISRHCLWRNFQTIRKKAGLERWKDAFKVMRKNCETDWAQRYPQYAVSTWLGHGIDVSARHYLQIPQELYDKVTSTNLPQTATKTATKSKTEMSERK
jgi:integrase